MRNIKKIMLFWIIALFLPMTFVNAKTVFISDDGTTDMNGFVINKGDLMSAHGWVLHEGSDVGNYDIYMDTQSLNTSRGVYNVTFKNPVEWVEFQAFVNIVESRTTSQ